MDRHRRDDFVGGVGEVHASGVGVFAERFAQELTMGFELAAHLMMGGFDILARGGDMSRQFAGDAGADLKQILSRAGQGEARQFSLRVDESGDLLAGLDQLATARLDGRMHSVDARADHRSNFVAGLDEAAARILESFANRRDRLQQGSEEHFAGVRQLGLLFHEGRARRLGAVVDRLGDLLSGFGDDILRRQKRFAQALDALGEGPRRVVAHLRDRLPRALEDRTDFVRLFSEGCGELVARFDDGRLRIVQDFTQGDGAVRDGGLHLRGCAKHIVARGGDRLGHHRGPGVDLVDEVGAGGGEGQTCVARRIADRPCALLERSMQGVVRRCEGGLQGIVRHRERGLQGVVRDREG